MGFDYISIPFLNIDLGIYFSFSVQKAKNCVVAGLYLKPALHTKETLCPSVVITDVPTLINQAQLLQAYMLS